ncbi:N-acetylmuramoyl-L-alanine amidase [Breznakiellaceae bacterium SP9]
MNRHRSPYKAVLCLLLMLFAFTACKQQNAEQTPALAALAAMPDIQVEGFPSQLTILDSFVLSAHVLPASESQELVWETSAAEVLRIEKGVLTAVGSGTARVSVRSKALPGLCKDYPIKVVLDPIKIVDFLHEERPLYRSITTYGTTQKQEPVYGSVSRYLFDDLNLHTEYMIPLDPQKSAYTGLVADNPEALLAIEANERIVRTGLLHPSLDYIVYHDTENNARGANALMHARYITSSDNINRRARSWHYTVDANTVYQQIPDDEVTWQGDSYEAYARSIGIETCIDEGADLFMTWQRSAKLAARLLLSYKVPINDVRQHHDMMASPQKDCPKTLRNAGLWDTALQLLQAEYLVAKELAKFKLSLSSLNPDYVNNKGRVIKVPTSPLNVRYTITISGPDNYIQQKTYTSVLAADAK